MPLCYVLVAGLMAFWAYKRRDEHLIIFLLLILVLGDSRQPGLQFVKNLRILCMVFLALISMWGLLRKEYALYPPFLLSIPFFLSASVSGLFSPNPILSYSKLISYFFMLLVVFHYLQYHVRRKREALLMDILYFAGWVYLIGLILIVFNPAQAFLGYRYRGIMGNPNGLGIYSSLIFAYMFTLWHLYPHRRKDTRWMLVLLFGSVLLCESRTALGSIALFWLLYKFYKGKPMRRRLFWFLVLPAFVLFIQSIDIQALVKSIGLAEYLRVESLTTGTGRFFAWALAWDEIRQQLWLGRGFEYENIFFHGLSDFLVGTEHQGGMHNSFLTFIMNTGLIGFGLFLAFLIIVLSRIKPVYLATPFLITTLISANFESWLAASLNAYTIHFFLVVMVLSNYYSLKKMPLAP